MSDGLEAGAPKPWWGDLFIAFATALRYWTDKGGGESPDIRKYLLVCAGLIALWRWFGYKVALVVWVLVQVDKDEEVRRKAACALSTAEARAKAVKCLENRAAFKCVPAAKPFAGGAEVPAAVRDIYSKYASASPIEYPEEVLLDLQCVGPSKHKKGWLRVARYDEGEVAAPPGGEVVFEVCGFRDADIASLRKPFPSLYHWLAFRASGFVKSGQV
jgi:hypothetical protein